MISSEYPLMLVVVVMSVVVIVFLLILYLVRSRVHDLIHTISKILHRMFRLTARACLRAEQRLRFRNHEVTKALAETLMERQLERRFLRIETLVENDIANYQKLSASLKSQLVSINEDYESSSDVPFAAPEWIDAVDAIATLQHNERNSVVMNKILADLHKTVQQHQSDVMREHRWTISSRHKLLSNLRPKWRKLEKKLGVIDSNIKGLRQRLHQVDQHMGQFELLTAGTRQGLMASMFMRFCIALCFVSVGVVAATINMSLLHAPLNLMLTQSSQQILPLAEMLSAFHIAITLVAAAMISESLRITHLFPLTAAMNRQGRNMLLIVGGILLVTLASIEVIILSNSFVVDATVSEAAVASAATPNSTEGMISSQWVLAGFGLLIPLILASTIVPFEYLLCTVRPVLGSVLQMTLHVSNLLLRLLGSIVLGLGKLITIVYDIIIFVPLGIELHWRNRQIQNVMENTSEKPQQLPASDVSLPNVTTLRFDSRRSNDK